MSSAHVHPNAVAAPAAGIVATVGLLGLAHTGVDAVAGSVSALLPTLDARFDLSGAQLGGLVATISVSSLLAQPLAGRIADRMGPKKVTVLGAVTSAALLALLGSVGHIGLVYALMVAGGLGSAGFHPAAAVVARRLLPERAQLAVSLFSAGGMLGLAFGPLAVLLLTAHAGLGFTPLLMIPGVALALVLWHLLPEDQPPPDRPPVRATRLLHGRFADLVVVGTLAATAVTTFNAGMPLWLTKEHGLANDAALIGWTLALFEVAAAAGGLLAGVAAARTSPARLAAAAMLAAPVALALTLATPPGSLSFYVSTLAAGALANAAFPLLIVAAQDTSDDAVAAASGMLMGFTHGLAGIAFIGVGLLADGAGLRAALLVGFAAILPAAALAVRALQPAAGSSPGSPPRPGLAQRCGCTLDHA